MQVLIDLLTLRRLALDLVKQSNALHGKTGVFDHSYVGKPVYGFVLLSGGGGMAVLPFSYREQATTWIRSLQPGTFVYAAFFDMSDYRPELMAAPPLLSELVGAPGY